MINKALKYGEHIAVFRLQPGTDKFYPKANPDKQKQYTNDFWSRKAEQQKQKVN